MGTSRRSTKLYTFETKNFVHATNCISKLSDLDWGFLIGTENRIWRWTHVYRSAKLGSKNSIGQCCFVAGTIESHCKIQNGVSIYEGIHLCDSVFVGPNVTFTNIKVPRAYINQKSYRKTVVGKGASIGGGAVILPGIKIGEFALIGAGSVVTKDVGKYEVVVGNPAKVVGHVQSSLPLKINKLMDD